MEPNCPQLLILDCDGVLIRSERANLAFYNHLFRHFGLDEVSLEDREQFGLLHTLSTPQVVARFFPEPLQKSAWEYAAALDFSPFSDLLEAEPGWNEVLPRLGERMKVCVATNRGKSAVMLLEKLGLTPFFDRIFTVKEVTRPKPAPDIVELALAYFGVEAQCALYVGDSELDSKAARDAGVSFVGFGHDGIGLSAPRRVKTPWELETLLMPPE